MLKAATAFAALMASVEAVMTVSDMISAVNKFYYGSWDMRHVLDVLLWPGLAVFFVVLLLRQLSSRRTADASDASA